MYKYLLALSSLAFAFNAVAVEFHGDPVTTKANVIIKQDSIVGIIVNGVNTKVPEDNIDSSSLFNLNISAPNTVSVSIAGNNETMFDQEGIVSSNAKSDGTKLLGKVDSIYLNKVTGDREYLPPSANQANGAAALLVKNAENVIQVKIIGADDKLQNVTPGEYVFSFVAQAYTE